MLAETSAVSSSRKKTSSRKKKVGGKRCTCLSDVISVIVCLVLVHVLLPKHYSIIDNKDSDNFHMHVL